MYAETMIGTKRLAEDIIDEIGTQLQKRAHLMKDVLYDCKDLEPMIDICAGFLEIYLLIKEGEHVKKDYHNIISNILTGVEQLQDYTK